MGNLIFNDGRSILSSVSLESWAEQDSVGSKLAFGKSKQKLQYSFVAFTFLRMPDLVVLREYFSYFVLFSGVS